MNKDFGDRLWLMAYKLRGMLSISELCRLVVYVLFIRYLDLEKSREGGIELPFYDEKFSVGYLALTYGKKVGPEEVVRYVADMEKTFLLEEAIVSEEIEALLEKSDAGQVQMIFDAVDEIGFADRSQLYEAASLLLDRMSYAHGNLSSDTLASLSLCRLEGRLLECKEGMGVYDGFCGYGLSANEAAGGKGILFLQDMDKNALGLAAVMTLFKGNRIGSVKHGDSLLSPMSREKYDRVVCEPPFVSKYGDEYCAGIPEGNCLCPEISGDASIALRHVLARMEDNGIAVVLVPNGIFIHERNKEIRKILADTYLDAMIELPAGASPDAKEAATLLVLRKDSQRKNVFIIDAKDFFEKRGRNRSFISDENIDRLMDLYHKRESTVGVSVLRAKQSLDNERKFCVLDGLIFESKDVLQAGKVEEYLTEYSQLAAQLAEVESSLKTLRSKFINGG